MSLDGAAGAVQKVVIEWIGHSDRHIVVGTDINGKIVGITYLQGYTLDGLLSVGVDGEYEWDEDLTKYVRWILPRLKVDPSENLINRIDDAIWIYVSREFELHDHS